MLKLVLDSQVTYVGFNSKKVKSSSFQSNFIGNL